MVLQRNVPSPNLSPIRRNGASTPVAGTAAPVADIEEALQFVFAENSGYSRAKSVNAEYFPQGLNLAMMYRMYKNDCVQHDRECACASLSKYKQVFYGSFNLRFKQPKKDTCTKCDVFRVKLEAARKQTGADDEVQKLEEQKCDHQKKAQAARESL